jgi:hypothetical protein
MSDSGKSSNPYKDDSYRQRPDLFKHLGASLPFRNPAEPAAPPEGKFRKLLERYSESRKEAGTDNSEAIDALILSLGSVKEADRFFSETAKYFEKTLPHHEYDITEFKEHLSTANWITGCEDLDFVYSTLKAKSFTGLDSLYGASDHIALGFFDNFALVLMVDIGAIVPREADSAT